ncbi:hypothetical protein [Pseudomonas sp. COR18]|uniref:hypothetical protein n=1 Tax=Pseudomonas sp. COR18 TaxID=3399680 RepID=UPI003B001F84
MKFTGIGRHKRSGFSGKFHSREKDAPGRSLNGATLWTLHSTYRKPRYQVAQNTPLQDAACRYNSPMRYRRLDLNLLVALDVLLEERSFE